MASSATLARRTGQLGTSADVQSARISMRLANVPSTEEGAYDDQDERGVLWTLVWCHERSCKEETKELRDTLGRVARDAGGKLFCVKKAKSYSAWQARAGRRVPHVLLTDWREIKPCLREMASDDPSASSWNRPRLMAVLVEQQRLFQRVRAWSETLGAAGGYGEVNVIRGIRDLSALLAKVNVVRGIHDVSALLAKVSLEPGRSPWSRSCATGQGPPIRGPGKGQETLGAHSAPFISSVSARGLPPSVVGVVSSICALQSAAAVERILKLAAMDQLYED